MNIHSIYARIFKVWRARRHRMFLEKIRPQPSDTLLDVGGFPHFWTQKPPFAARIDTLNPDAAPPAKTCGHNIRTLTGDGCHLPFPDRSYDIGFSNSVIEHVGSWERQQQFAAEIRRVSKALWVQTPAYGCPIEPHYMAPFIHWLPQSLQRKLIRWFTPFGWLERPDRARIAELVATTRLLRKAEMRQLFPDCEILTERMLGIIPKSYIAIRS